MFRQESSPVTGFSQCFVVGLSGNVTWHPRPFWLGQTVSTMVLSVHPRSLLTEQQALLTLEVRPKALRDLRLRSGST